MHLSSDPNQYSIQDCSPGRIIYIHTRVRSRIRVRPPTQIYGSAISATTRAALSIRWALRTSPCRGPYARAYRAYRLMRPWQHQKSRTSCPSAETLLLASHVTLLDFVIFFNYLPLIWIRSTGCKSNCDPADTDPGTNEPTSAAEWRVSARYDGAVPIRQRYARTHNRN